MANFACIESDKSTYRCYVDQSNGKRDHDYGESEYLAGVLSFFEKRAEFVHQARYYAFQTTHLKMQLHKIDDNVIIIEPLTAESIPSMINIKKNKTDQICDPGRVATASG